MHVGFTALQTDTINRRKSSLCRYGIAHYFAGVPVTSTVKVFEPFDRPIIKEPYNLNTPEQHYVDKSGIDPRILPFLPRAYDEMKYLISELKDHLVVSYAGTTVERRGLEELTSFLGIEMPRIYFVDVRDLFDVFYPGALDQGLISGRKKAHICDFLGLEYHHTTNGVSDAYASGSIFNTLYQQYRHNGESPFDFSVRQGCVVTLHNRELPRWAGEE